MKYEHGIKFESYLNRRRKGEKNMDVILREDELKKAVEEYLAPRMKQHDVEDVLIREVKIDNRKQLEVIARIKEKEDES